MNRSPYVIRTTEYGIYLEVVGAAFGHLGVTVGHNVRKNKGEREKQETEEKETDKAITFAAGDSGGPKSNGNPNDCPEDYT